MDSFDRLWRPLPSLDQVVAYSFMYEIVGSHNNG